VGTGPGIEFRSRGPHKAARHEQPKRVTVILDEPVNRIARQSVLMVQRREMMVLELAESTLSRGPERPDLVDSKLRHTAVAEAVRRSERGQNAIVREVHDAPPQKTQPQPALGRSSSKRGRVIRATERLPGKQLNRIVRRHPDEPLALVGDP